MPVTLVCRVCHQSFQVPPSRAQRVTMCSRKCMGLAQRKTIEERFWSKVDKSGPTMRPELGPCWIWTGDRHDAGYGRLTDWRDGQRQKPLYAHRVAWEIANGEGAEGGEVLHRCDHPPCVNPAHLFIGTHLDNMHDRDAKGRVAAGERSGRRAHPERYPAGEQWSFAKLTDAQVEAIRVTWIAGGVSQAALARLYHVHQSTINRIVRYKKRRKEAQEQR